MSKKAPNPVDRHVGARVRLARMMLPMSQEKLGAKIGITFQQIQKYEKGTNRIGSSRMHQIFQALGRPVAWFFDGLNANAATMPDDPIVAFASTRDGFDLAVAFNRIEDGPARRAVVDVAQALANGEQVTRNAARRAA